MISRAVGFVFVFCCYLASITSEAKYVELNELGLPKKSLDERHILQSPYWNGGKSVFDWTPLEEAKDGINEVVKQLKKVKSNNIEALMAMVVDLDKKEASRYKGSSYQKDLAVMVKIKENSDTKQCTDDAVSAIKYFKSLTYHEKGWGKNETQVEEIVYHYALENAQLCLEVYENNILEGLKSLDGDKVVKVERVLSDELIDKYRSLHPDNDANIFKIRRPELNSEFERSVETFNLIVKPLHEGEDSRDTLKRIKEDLVEPCKYYVEIMSPSMNALYFAGEILSLDNKNFVSELPLAVKNALYRNEFCKYLPDFNFWVKAIKQGYAE